MHPTDSAGPTGCAKPLPVIDALTEPFWDHARSHRLAVQRCVDCGDHHFPPSPVCPVCLSDDQDWQVVSGLGTLVSWAVFHRAYWPGFQPDLPYPVCLVQLDEGPLLVSNFRNGLPDGVRAGMRLRAVFDDVTETVTLPRFVAA